MELKLKNFISDGKCFYVKVHILDGETEDFGPFDLDDLKRLFIEKRINGSVFVFCPSLDGWKVLADFVDFKDVFGEDPPEVTSFQRRLMSRRELDSRAQLKNETNILNVKTVDLSMLAIKISYSDIDYEFQLDEQFSLEIDHELFQNEKINVSVLRLFDSNGVDGSLTLRFMDLSNNQKNIISNYIHF